MKRKRNMKGGGADQGWSIKILKGACWWGWKHTNEKGEAGEYQKTKKQREEEKANVKNEMLGYTSWIQGKNFPFFRIKILVHNFGPE